MNKLKKLWTYFSVGERILWSASVGLIIAAFLLFDGGDPLTVVASLIGATSLIFGAKGNPAAQVLIILFGLLYGVVSWSFAYYGEMITYMGMTVPMAVVALIAWLRNPFGGNRAEVTVNRMKGREYALGGVLTVLVTVVFYFILKQLGTANLLPSTLSVATSFLAVYLTARRSPCYALAYAANDMVLIVLWVLATLTDLSYLSMVICFAIFLVNDLYGFYNWRRMLDRQQAAICQGEAAMVK